MDVDRAERRKSLINKTDACTGEETVEETSTSREIWVISKENRWVSDTAAAELNLPNSPVGDAPVKGVGAGGEEEQMKQK